MEATRARPARSRALTPFGGTEATTRRSALAPFVRAGTLEVMLPDGSRRVAGGHRPGPAAEIAVSRPGLLRRLVRSGAMGLAESYLEGWWDSPDLATFLEFAARNADLWLGGPAGRLREPVASMWDRLKGARPGAVPSMREHYDLGNEFYSLWLDDSMTYSCAVFESPHETLEQAQARKYRMLAETADLRPGHRVLEIGTGWGSFAVYLARDLGCHVTTVTIAREQAAHAREAARRARVADRVDVQLRDYREITGRYDRAVSIEMIESIDERQWPGFLRAVARALEPGGRFGLQSITMSERHWNNHARHQDFVMAYIFPGGRVPAVSVLRELTADAGFRWAGTREIGASYVLTLAEWRRRFEAATAEVEALGFGERFRRMWRYYLAYCEAGFRTGWLGDRQIALIRRSPRR